MKVKIDSTLEKVWETEIFLRTSKYSPMRDASFQMRYDAANQQIIAFYSLANDEKTSANLFTLDTLGTITLHKKISANELTYLTDAHIAEDGIYFCGWTSVGLGSPLLDFGWQGLIGFISRNGEVSQANVGIDRQGRYVMPNKLMVDDSLKVYSFHMHHTFWGARTEWRLLKFKRDFF